MHAYTIISLCPDCFSCLQALAAASAMVEGKMGDDMKKFLKKHIIKKELTDELAVMDNKLGGSIKEDLGIQVRFRV